MKVGKAIYNILSRAIPVQQNIGFSTDTFAPSGEELVTNGDFSATGSELVTNGSFENNGDNWTIEEGSGTVTFPNNLAKIISTGAAAQTGITQNILTNNKSYKVTIDVASITGTLKLLMGGNGNVTLITAPGIQTFYLQTATITNATFYLIRNIGDTVDVVLNSVSVKELGEGWTDLGNPLKAASFNANGLTITSVNGNGNNNRVFQANVTEDAKSYKVTYTIHARTLTGSNVLQYYNGSSYVVMPTTIIGTAQTFYFTRLNTDDHWYFRIGTFNGSTTDFVTISSVSVQELGEGWTLNGVGGISFNGGGLSLDSSEIDTSGGGTVYSSCFQVGTIFEIGKSYKLIIENLDITSGSIELKFGRDFNTVPQRPVLTSENNGIYTDYFTAVDTDDGFTINNGGNTVATLSSISVQEMVLTKIFPEIAPPDIDPPYIVYSVVSNQPSNTKNENGEIDEASLEVYSFQDTYNKTVDLGVAVRASLDRVNGTFATVKVDSINYTNEQMDVNESRKLWAAIQDYTVRIKNI